MLFGIDHPVIAVRNMAAARTAYERMGFTIPPRGSHIEWGTGNWCIMFERDYLELRGIVDASRYLHGLDAFLAQRGEGLMGCAFRPAVSAQASYDGLRRAGFSPQKPRALTRNFELPAGNVPVRFELTFFAPDELPGFMSSLVCEHRTPEVMRSPEWLRHDNGALRVQSVTAVVDDLDGFFAAARRMIGEGAAAVRSSGAVAIATDPHSYIRAVTPAQAEREGHAGARDGAHLVALGIEVVDLGQTARLMAARGIDGTLGDNRLRIPPERACGTAIDFVAGAPGWLKEGSVG
jgi:hypothetical protein